MLGTSCFQGGNVKKIIIMKETLKILLTLANLNFAITVTVADPGTRVQVALSVPGVAFFLRNLEFSSFFSGG